MIGIVQVFNVNFYEASLSNRRSQLVASFQVGDKESECKHVTLSSTLTLKLAMCGVLASCLSIIVNGPYRKYVKYLDVYLESNDLQEGMERLFDKFNHTNRDLNKIAEQIKERAGNNDIKLRFKTSAQGGNVAQNLYSAGRSYFYAPEIDSFGYLFGEWNRSLP